VDTGLLALPSPRLPRRRTSRAIATLAVAGSLHLIAAIVVILAFRTAEVRAEMGEVRAAAAPVIRVELPRRLIFLPTAPTGAGGGGGGNRQPGPIRRASGVGHDAITLRATRRPPTTGITASEPEPPAVVLDAVPLASGTFNMVGLPEGGVAYGDSTGPGSGGGVGAGIGTGIGSGRGPGFGPGSGGGFGGGAYRPGGAVTAPRLLSQVQPRYTPDALERKIQGSVWLDVVVTREGRAGEVRVTRPLDPGGLDEEAIRAVREWRFEPGRLAGAPVDVLVTVVMGFSIR
jgi:TonB family protein